MIKIYNKNNFKLESVRVKTYNPFSDGLIESVQNLSKNIIDSKEAKKSAEIMALGFWLRKSNILNFKKKYNENELKFSHGLGLLFHVPPSNMDTGFVYSLMFGLLTGNTNIVRVPEKSLSIANYLISKININ